MILQQGQKLAKCLQERDNKIEVKRSYTNWRQEYKLYIFPIIFSMGISQEILIGGVGWLHFQLNNFYGAYPVIPLMLIVNLLWHHFLMIAFPNLVFSRYNMLKWPQNQPWHFWKLWWVLKYKMLKSVPKHFQALSSLDMLYKAKSSFSFDLGSPIHTQKSCSLTCFFILK